MPCFHSEAFRRSSTHTGSVTIKTFNHFIPLLLFPASSCKCLCLCLCEVRQLSSVRHRYIMRPRPSPRLLPPVNDADLLKFPEKILCFVINYSCYLIAEADKVSRSLGEKAVKEMIADGIVKIRDALEDVTHFLPKDEHTRRDYAQRFLEATEKNDEERTSPKKGALVFDAAEIANGVDGDEGIEGSLCPEEMCRVREEFGAMDVSYTEQDLVCALGWVRTVVYDVQQVLLNFEDGDLEDLAQITIISLRIFVWYAKSTHRTICRLCGVVGMVRPIGTPERPSDNGAGPNLPVEFDPYWPNTFDMNAEGMQGPEDGGGLPWEPLVPRLLHEAQRLAAEGKGRPLTSAVILAAVLPFSGVAVFFGAPVLAGDAALQWGASTAVGRTIGQGTKNAVELGRLGWIASKLATKQTVRLASRELDRVGGVSGLACLVGGGALWSAAHPIEATKTGIQVAGNTGKLVYEQAMWMGDLFATIGEEMFAGSQ